MNIKKMTYAGLLIAIGVLLPQIFHIFGPQAGKIFLPIHICVFIGGLTLGSLFGLIIGLITPLLSSLLTGMPTIPIAIFMVFELSLYGFLAGIFYRKYNLYISLILSQIVGRLIYVIILIVSGLLLSIHIPPAAGVWAAFLTGLLGIILQLILIPPVVKLLEKGSALHFERTNKKIK